MSTDAPSGDVRLEQEAWDAERVRRSLEIARAQGRVVVETVAVAPSGRLAGYTTLAVAQHTPDVAYQWDTLVLREHRGHALGRRLKDANLAALLARLPSVRRVVTWNATTNGPMLAVNRALGFEVAGVLTEWQKRLAPTTRPPCSP
ncbi:hypothetical protein GCM10025868_33330 [Angustibacter aerolatus]|uniref:N-acetyltransferase domain-containing protein n=1 Tax=Angustibacter aerolatus TaxID=1162965 RepID=A0ABQ6JL11_9ACTN|nr:GNAT family N-acetyltransferase [Angustibacter aerolatus]GMA88083.1 hypothetical protein GCM10025868_33330 [Angustibacter aerolatus]